MWPTPQDYNEAVQTPETAFADGELQRATPALNALGLPKPVSGSFASVYQMHTRSGTCWAVRCFLRNVPDQEERYAHISAHLRTHPLSYTVPFEFIRQGVRIGGRWYPILKMQWVEGTPLIEWIDNEDVAVLQVTMGDTTIGKRAAHRHEPRLHVAQRLRMIPMRQLSGGRPTPSAIPSSRT